MKELIQELILYNKIISDKLSSNSQLSDEDLKTLFLQSIIEESFAKDNHND